MTPELRVYVAALRAGSGADCAFHQFCWASLLVPVWMERDRPSESWFPAWGRTMCDAMGADAFEAGATDDEIAEAFAQGLDIDHERDIRWRDMRRDERPTTGDLLSVMSIDDQLTAARFLGLSNVAHAIVTDRRW